MDGGGGTPNRCVVWAAICPQSTIICLVQHTRPLSVWVGRGFCTGHFVGSKIGPFPRAAPFLCFTKWQQGVLVLVVSCTVPCPVNLKVQAVTFKIAVSGGILWGPVCQKSIQGIVCMFSRQHRHSRAFWGDFSCQCWLAVLFVLKTDLVYVNSFLRALCRSYGPPYANIIKFPT